RSSHTLLRYLSFIGQQYILIVSFIGYATEEIKINGRRNINIRLREDTKALDEVVVVGYGQQKKESVVVSMSSVKPSEIAAPTRNLTNNLAGQVSGLIAVQRSGEPGYDDAEFWIRGISTFASNSSASAPLVLVDGVPRKITDIEPDEIETFSVLKDAAATAIYGAEGANGVILVTTKRGKDEKPKITFKTEHSISSPQRLPEFVGSADYLSLYNEALNNDGEPDLFSAETIEKFRTSTDRDLYPDTDWISELLRKNTHNHRYTLNVRGGSARSRYFVSGAYYTESGIYKGNPTEKYDTNIGLDRFNLRSNIDMDVTSTTLVSIDLAGQYLIANYPGESSSTIFRSMLITPPYCFPAVYSDGTVATYEQERGVNMRNPYNQLMNSGYTRQWRTGIQSKVGIRQKLDFITKGLSAKVNVSYDFDATFKSIRSYNPSRYHAIGRDENGNLTFIQVVSGTPDLSDLKDNGIEAQKRIYIDAAINYKHTFAEKHDVSGMLLYMQKETQLKTQPLPYRKQGLVGRISYSFDGRYFLEGNFGYTGSEAFAKNHRFGFFPAVGLAYYLSNEPFYPGVLKNYVNKVKLRASVGKTGNDTTSDRFIYRPTYSMNAGSWSQGIGSNGGTNSLGQGIIEGFPETLNIGWEIEKKQNYGFDLGLFNNKIDIVFDYFRSERSNILMQRKTTPTLSGFRVNQYANYGIVSNHGIDMSLNAHHRIGKVKLSARGTFTFARNKIKEYDELSQKYPWMERTGKRINENNLYIAERLYTKDDFIISKNSNGIENYTLRPELPQSTLGGLLGPGDIKYKDVNGDGVIDSYDKVVGVGHPTVPEIVYGFGLNIEYKGFYASVFFQGTGNCSVLLGGNTPEGWYPFAWGVDQSSYRTFALDRWTESNPSQNVLMPRLHKDNTNNANNQVASTWWLRNGGFLRLKNMEFGYQLPKQFLKKFNAQAARIYVMGYNLALWDDLKYFDPEAGNANGGNVYPKNRTFTLGIDFTF
ncbi:MULTISPECIES: SusC/RagA family TonB-linked outer membrane protein, partial [Bacteroidaceae]